MIWEGFLHWEVMWKGVKSAENLFGGGSQGGSWESGKRGGKLCSALGGKKGWSFHLGTRMWRDLPEAGLCSCPSQGSVPFLPSQGMAGNTFLRIQCHSVPPGCFSLGKLCPYFNSVLLGTTPSLGKGVCGKRLRGLELLPGKRDEEEKKNHSATENTELLFLCCSTRTETLS